MSSDIDENTPLKLSRIVTENSVTVTLSGPDVLRVDNKDFACPDIRMHKVDIYRGKGAKNFSIVMDNTEIVLSNRAFLAVAAFLQEPLWEDTIWEGGKRIHGAG